MNINQGKNTKLLNLLCTSMEHKLNGSNTHLFKKCTPVLNKFEFAIQNSLNVEKQTYEHWLKSVATTWGTIVANMPYRKEYEKLLTQETLEIIQYAFLHQSYIQEQLEKLSKSGQLNVMPDSHKIYSAASFSDLGWTMFKLTLWVSCFQGSFKLKSKSHDTEILLSSNTETSENTSHLSVSTFPLLLSKYHSLTTKHTESIANTQNQTRNQVIDVMRETMIEWCDRYKLNHLFQVSINKKQSNSKANKLYLTAGVLGAVRSLTNEDVSSMVIQQQFSHIFYRKCDERYIKLENIN